MTSYTRSCSGVAAAIRLQLFFVIIVMRGCIKHRMLLRHVKDRVMRVRAMIDVRGQV